MPKPDPQPDLVGVRRRATRMAAAPPDKVRRRLERLPTGPRGLKRLP